MNKVLSNPPCVIPCTVLLDCIRGRLKQHRDNLALWKAGILRPTVEDDEEQCAVMHDLCVAIAELETVLMQYTEPSHTDTKL
jgi:hypothetical protein